MVLGGEVTIEIAYKADAEGDVIEVVARDMSAVDLAGPAIANFDLSIARGIAVSNDKMISESVLHFADIAVVVLKNTSISLAGSAVVNDDVFPTSALDLCAIYGLADGRCQVSVALHEAAERRSGRRLVSFLFLEA